MSVSDTDWNILMKKLEDIDKRLEKLENDVKAMKPSYTFATTGCLLCGKYDCPAALTNIPCPKGAPYALASGNLVDAGLDQEWRVATDKEDYEE